MTNNNAVHISISKPVPFHKGSSVRKRNGLITAVLLILIAISIIFIENGYFGLLKVHVYGEAFELTCAISSLFVCALILFMVKKDGKIDWFEPPVWFCIYTFIQVIVNVWLLQRDRLTIIPSLIHNTGIKMSWAVILFDVGLGSLCLGYLLARKLYKKKSNLAKPTVRLNLRLAILIWFITWIIWIVSAVVGVGGYQTAGTIVNVGWENYFYFINLINITATSALVLYISAHPTRLGWIWLGIVVVTMLVLSVFVGSKRFAISFIWLFMSLFYGFNKLPKRWIMLGMLMIFTFVPLVNNYRNVINNNLPGRNLSIGSSIIYRGSSLIEAIGNTFSQPLDYFISSTQNTFKLRQAGILDVSASVLVMHPDKIPFVGLEMVKEFFPQLIPRIFWPSKPTTRSPLLMITTTYGGAHSEYTFSSIGFIADAYRAGGWLFVIVFCSLMGVLLRSVYSNAIEKANPALTCLYITILSIVLIDREVSTILNNLIQFGIFLWFITLKGLYHRVTITHNNQINAFEF